MEKLFYILKQKGSITADEYDLLVANDEGGGAERAESGENDRFPCHRATPGADRIEGREPRIDAFEHEGPGGGALPHE
jgi:hypothetical protein